MSAPTTCTITGSVKNLLGSGVQNCVVYVSVITPFIHPSNGAFYSGELESTTTDSSGNFSIGVVETTTPGVKVRFVFDYYDGVSNRRQKTYAVVVPNQSSAVLTDLITADINPVTTNTFPAASVTVATISGLSAGNAQDAFAEHQSDIDTINTALSNKQSTALTSAHILVGNASNLATDVALSGDATIDNTGALTVANSAITNAKVSASAAIAYSKLALTGAVLNADLAGSIAASKLIGSDIATVGTITSGTWSGTVISKAKGGTGADNSSLTFPSSGTVQATTPNNHGVLVSGAGATATVVAPNASTALPFVSGGASADPSWAALTVPGGGTGVTSTTAYAVLCGGTTSTAAIQSVAALGSSGDVLTSNGASALPTFQSVPTAPTQPDKLQNLGISVTAASNILTIALKQSDGSTAPAAGSGAVKASLRSSTATSGAYNERSITAALSQTLTQVTTCSLISNPVGFPYAYLWLYLLDSDGAGTMKLAASPVRYDDTQLQSTVAESVTGTVTIASPGVWTSNGHGYNNGDCIRLSTTGALPTGLSANTDYFIVSKAANTFQLAATIGGTAINTSGSQSGTHTIHSAGFRLVSDAVYTNMPVRLIGRAGWSTVPSGVWTSPALVCVGDNKSLRESILVNSYGSTTNTANATSTIVAQTSTAALSHGLMQNTGVSGTGQRINIPLSGMWDVNAALEWTTNGTNSRFITVSKNGSTLINRTQTTYTSNAYNQDVSGTYYFSQNDYIELFAQQNSTATLALTGTAANYLILRYRGP